ncbi:MAG: hypothetical protein IKW94_04520 [Pseudobutyrivibrio sp.]|nr:hypothetical protein [Pseudobutyrivibrio sp.]
MIDTIKKITAICDGDLLVEIDDNNCILFYKVEEADIAQEISIWPAIRIRLEDSLISFREKLAEVEVIIAQNKKLSKIKYCKVKHINVDDDYIIADIYVKGTVEVA